MALCALEVRPHAVSLLARLNLQRKQNQFCDCVLRQKDNPDRVYPAHRCVLAASSPVFASILSSSGVLVELQDPWLPDSLPSLLDYFYTGALPYIRSHEQHHSLFTAACYLQVEELREALRAWQPSVDTEIRTVIKATSHLPLPSKASPQKGIEEIVNLSVQHAGGLPVSRSHPCPAQLEASVEAKTRTVPEMCGNSSETEGTKVKPEEGKTTATGPCGRGSPHICCEAVPVIRHSSGATVLRLEQASSPQCGSSSESVITAHTGHGGLTNPRTSDIMKCTASPREHDGDPTSFTHSDNIPTSCDSLLSSTKPLMEDSVLQTTESEVGFLSKRQTTSQRCRPFVATASDGLDSQVLSGPEDCHPEGGAEDDHSYSVGFAAQMEVQDSNGYNTETSGLSAPALQADQPPILNTPVDMKEQDVAATLRPGERRITGRFSSFHCYTSQEPEEITETSVILTLPADPHAANPPHSQHWHHCPTDDDIRAGCGEDGSDHLSESSDGEEGGDFSDLTQSELKERFAPGPSQHVVLLDISSKAADLLDSCGHSSETGEKGDRRVTSEPRIRSQKTAATLVAQDVTEQIIKDRFQAKSSVGASTKSHVSDRTSYFQAQRSEEVKPKLCEKQISPWTVSSPGRVSDSLCVSLSSSSSSLCMSSSPTCKPADRSAPRPASVRHPFQCHLCTRSFSQRGSLNRHVRSHLGVRPFPCPRCPMTFSRQYRVVEHMRVHQRCVLGNEFQMTSDPLI